MDNLLDINNNNLEEVLKNEVVVLDFWAPWCGPCRMFAPTYKEFSNEVENVIVGKVNTDENKDIAEKYNVRSIPSILFIKNGEVVDTIFGPAGKDTLKEKLNNIS